MTTPRMPDPPVTGSCAPASPLDVATVLEEAADQILVRGRWRDALEGPDGQVCVMQAVYMYGLQLAPRGDSWFADRDVKNAAFAALGSYTRDHFGLDPVNWNSRVEEDDEVRDTLLLVAKDLRNTAVPS